MTEELTRRLNAAAEDARTAARLTAPERVRARGDRRRQAATTVVAAAAGIVVAAVLVTAGVVVGHRSMPPPAATPAGVRTEISDAVRMPHEGDPVWEHNDDPRARSAFTGCRADDPTLVGRTDARTMTGRGDAESEKHSPTRAIEQLFLFDSESAAVAAIATLNTGGERCGWQYLPEGHIEALLVSNAEAGFLVGSGKTQRCQILVECRKYVAGWQLGNAVFLVYLEVGGVGMSGVPDDTLLVAHELCVKMAICPDPPAPTPTPSVKMAICPDPAGPYPDPERQNGHLPRPAGPRHPDPELAAWSGQSHATCPPGAVSPDDACRRGRRRRVPHAHGSG